MDDSQIRIVVRAQEGADLRREPTLKSKTEDGSENKILSLPLGTRLILLGSGLHTNDGHQWGHVRLESGSEQQTGWVDADYFMEQRELIVTVSEGADLRREPGMSSKTEDGKENVIFSLSRGTRLRLLSNVVRTADGHGWGLVRPVTGAEGETGWVMDEHLVPNEAEAPPETLFTFTFGGKTYQIFEDKLSAAIGQFIFRTPLPGSQVIHIDNDSFFTTQDNITAMKSPGLRLIEEIG